MSFFAKIPQEFIENNIKWLVIEKDKEETSEFFLFFHQSMEEPCDSDLWFEKIEYAYEAARAYGLEKSDWMPLGN